MTHETAEYLPRIDAQPIMLEGNVKDTFGMMAKDKPVPLETVVTRGIDAFLEEADASRHLRWLGEKRQAGIYQHGPDLEDQAKPRILREVILMGTALNQIQEQQGIRYTSRYGAHKKPGFSYETGIDSSVTFNNGKLKITVADKNGWQGYKTVTLALRAGENERGSPEIESITAESADGAKHRVDPTSLFQRATTRESMLQAGGGILEFINSGLRTRLEAASTALQAKAEMMHKYDQLHREVWGRLDQLFGSDTNSPEKTLLLRDGNITTKIRQEYRLDRKPDARRVFITMETRNPDGTIEREYADIVISRSGDKLVQLNQAFTDVPGVLTGGGSRRWNNNDRRSAASVEDSSLMVLHRYLGYDTAEVLPGSSIQEVPPKTNTITVWPDYARRKTAISLDLEAEVHPSMEGLLRRFYGERLESLTPEEKILAKTRMIAQLWQENGPIGVELDGEKYALKTKCSKDEDRLAVIKGAEIDELRHNPDYHRQRIEKEHSVIAMTHRDRASSLLETNFPNAKGLARELATQPEIVNQLLDAGYEQFFALNEQRTAIETSLREVFPDPTPQQQVTMDLEDGSHVVLQLSFLEAAKGRFMVLRYGPAEYAGAPTLVLVEKYSVSFGTHAELGRGLRYSDVNVRKGYRDRESSRPDRWLDGPDQTRAARKVIPFLEQAIKQIGN